MKKLLHALLIAGTLSNNTAHTMQQSINTKQIGLFACITAGCGISFYIINKYKHSLHNWFTSFKPKLSIYTQHNPIKNNNVPSQSVNNSKPSPHTQKIELPTDQPQKPHQNNHSIILPSISVEELQQSTTQYLKKEEARIPDTADLHTACENNDVQAITLLLQDTTTNINAKRNCSEYHPWNGPVQHQGETALHIACQNNNTEIVTMLLACNGIDINIQNKDGDSPLHIACQNSNEEIVDLLLACEGIKITLQNNNGDSPLHIACKTGTTKLDYIFLNKMFLSHKIYDQKSPYLFPEDLKKYIAHFLLLCYKDAIVQKLLFCDASNLNTQNRKSESAIYLAYLHNHKTIFSLLFSQNNIDLTNLLALACKRHDMDMITQLLKHKNIELVDSKAALYTACKNGYNDIVTLLLSYNKNNCMKINDEHNNPLLVTCQEIKNLEKSSPDRTKFVTIIQALLNDPAIDINIKTQNGLTVFHCVVSDCDLLRLLLDKDDRFISEKETSTSGCPSEMNQTPLHEAIKAGNLESIFLLLEHGADLLKKNCNGDSPLALACNKASKESSQWFGKNTYKDIVVQLLESPYITQEIINSSDCLYSSNLENTNYSIPQLLLEYGADPNKIKGKSGISPILKVARCNIPLLNLFIDTYKGDSTQKNSVNQTVLYIAFMLKKINHPNEINFFKNLNADEQSSFMERELTIIADSTPHNVCTWYPRSYSKNDIKENNNNIQLFNAFITTCLQHVKKDFNLTLLIDTAYANLQKRDKSFYVSDNNWRKKCMHLNEDICRYTHDTYNHKSYDGCDDCRTYFPYNELIMHGLIQHINPITTEQAVDKTIALTYKQEPAIYYLKTTQEKENQKKYLKEQIEKLNLK